MGLKISKGLKRQDVFAKGCDSVAGGPHPIGISPGAQSEIVCVYRCELINACMNVYVHTCSRVIFARNTIELLAEAVL